MHKLLSHQTGLHLDDLRCDPKQGMKAAAQCGFRIVQVGAARGELTPHALSDSGRRHVTRHADGLGLTIAALGTDFSGARFTDSLTADQCVANSKRVLELARDLGAAVVSAPIGRFRAHNAEQFHLLREALGHLGEHADKIGTHFAIETSVDCPDDLATLLSELNCAHLNVCYDPAELLMDGHDPLAPAERYAEQIALSYLRDATAGTPHQPGREMILGQGVLNIEAYLGQIEQAGYAGPHIIRRAAGESPLADLQAARQHLEQLLEKAP